MLSKVFAAGLNGTEGFPVCVESDLHEGLPGITLIGYLSSAVREAADRVLTAIRNSGIRFEPRKLTVNLSPADIRKEGCGYDLAIAVGVLRCYGYIGGEICNSLLEDSVFIGELGLGGELRPVHGILSLALAARNAGFQNIFVPNENALEGGAIEGINCYGVRSLNSLIDILNGRKKLPEKAVYQDSYWSEEIEKDFSDVCGQELIKRATVIAVGGRHNILYIGPAGTGKSMIASRIPGIMPRMTKEERLEISKIYSVSGLLPKGQPLLASRPFRSPHHTITATALTGGGTIPKPGEITLASGGVLFLDELAEFPANTLDLLRQPMESKSVSVSRVYGSTSFPADFVLCAATNPCKCGYYPDRNKCRCTDVQVRNYLGKISKPILDRIDICVETAIPDFSSLKKAGKGLESEEIRKRVEEVRQIQLERLLPYGLHFNSEMTGNELEIFCQLHHDDEEFLQKYYERKGLSARGLNKILKVSRTIADFDGSVNIRHEHLCEALSYRNLEEKYWGGGLGNGYRTKISAFSS